MRLHLPPWRTERTDRSDLQGPTTLRWTHAEDSTRSNSIHLLSTNHTQRRTKTSACNVRHGVRSTPRHPSTVHVEPDYDEDPQRPPQGGERVAIIRASNPVASTGTSSRRSSWRRSCRCSEGSDGNRRPPAPRRACPKGCSRSPRGSGAMTRPARSSLRWSSCSSIARPLEVIWMMRFLVSLGSTMRKVRIPEHARGSTDDADPSHHLVSGIHEVPPIDAGSARWSHRRRERVLGSRTALDDRLWTSGIS